MEYCSKSKLLGLPLVHINAFHFKREKRNRVTARGWIAIGNIALSPFIAIGGIAIGTFSFGAVAIGLLLAIGSLAAGAIALGAVAIGVISVGGLAIAMFFSMGELSIAMECAIETKKTAYEERVIYECTGMDISVFTFIMQNFFSWLWMAFLPPIMLLLPKKKPYDE